MNTNNDAERFSSAIENVLRHTPEETWDFIKTETSASLVALYATPQEWCVLRAALVAYLSKKEYQAKK